MPLLIKLSESILSMCKIDYEPAPVRRVIAQKALDFFVPLAKNLNFTEIYDELQTRCESVLTV